MFWLMIRQITDKIDYNFMSDTINTFQDFFKEESKISEFNVYDAFENVKTLLSETITLNSIKIKENIDKNVKCIGCINSLSQVLLSIMYNSIYFLKNRNIHNPEIKISISQTDDVVIINLEDNAQGVCEKFIDKIFEYNYSYRDTQVKSTGLGLYISKLIIEEKFKGDIKASNANKGLEIIISFENKC